MCCAGAKTDSSRLPRLPRYSPKGHGSLLIYGKDSCGLCPPVKESISSATSVRDLSIALSFVL